jgi:hypothetical protein
MKFPSDMLMLLFVPVLIALVTILIGFLLAHRLL